ncbi:hypothetical protein [uncultured Litoreibacter sp.]|uniref:hypothetical protein n=1 Tax=uncultured Litoreibacter sp. TaxID=1392394 RepID=UPI00261D1823|nr:hypothetical protein [uncultured Litoreibacter sp.]
MEKPTGDERIDAELVSIQGIDVDEIIILTDGLKARSRDDGCVQFYPIWRDGEPTWGGDILCETFRSFIEDRCIEVIGVKQITRTNDGTHWRWAPANACHNPPHNNPSYRWSFISSGIRQSIKSGTRLNFIGEKSSEPISDVDTRRLADLAKHIAIDLHQLNHAIAMMAEHLHTELVSQGPRCSRYSHIRNLDLSAHVHGFFQAFSAARDHYAQFLTIQIGRKKVKGLPIDSMSKLLNAVEPSQLRQLNLIKLLEQRNLLEIGEGAHNHAGECRLVYKSDTWLKYTNKLRNRFTHGSPYGTSPDEDITEIYQPDCDSTIYLAKSFLEKGEEGFPLNILRTTNHSYQAICGLFLFAAEATGYESSPPLVTTNF